MSRKVVGTTAPIAPMTPVDEQKARIQERTDYLEMLDDRLQLQESEIRLLR